MNRFFKRLPLPVKLLLIGLIPLALLIYTSREIYADKNGKINLLSSYIERIHQAAYINTLIDYLEKERKYSFDYAMTKNKRDELMNQRPRTDSAIQQLEKSGLTGFTNYTFLNDLQKWRNQIDSGYLAPGIVMHYYTTAIFRINVLNTVSPGSEIYLQPVYKDLVGQKLLSEMITNLGIMRSNIYNVLYTKKYMVETLAGMIGVHDVYKTYETEFLAKASPEAIQSYQKAMSSAALQPTVAYLDTLFKRFKPDSSYTADNWWQVSNEGIEQLINLRQQLWGNVVTGTTNILKEEKTARSRSFIFLGLGLLLVIAIVAYIIYSINHTLAEMKEAAQKISEGTGNPVLDIGSGDVIGSLAQSISRIGYNNKILADAADAIGKGDFGVKVEPRGKDDMLGHAIVRMKDNLVKNNELLQQSVEKYKTIFYKSPLPKWIYDMQTLRFLDVNEAATLHYGYTREEFLTMTLADIRPPEERQELLDHIAEIRTTLHKDHRLTTDKPYWRHLKKNGEIIIVEVTAHFIDYNNQQCRMAVMIDKTEKIKAEEQLERSHEELRELSLHLQNIREEERTSMAREVHDELGQQITCIKMDFSWLLKRLNNDDPTEREKIKTITDLLDHTSKTVRKIATDLRPSILDDFGLIEALEWHSGEFEKRSGIKVTFVSAVHNIAISEIITTALFRVYQESLTNVARHAAATLVTANVALEDEQLVLTISDNGKGFNVQESGQKKTLGLRGMRERTQMLGGKYEIDSMPGKGTTITVCVPLQVKEKVS